MDSALELVDKLAATLPIDKRRIYVTGLCTGGFGTWDALAAAAEVLRRGHCHLRRAATPTQAAIMKDVPIWAFHGDRDPVVPVEHTRSHDRGDSQGRRPPENDHLSRRRPRLLERNLRRSRGDGLAVRAEERKVTQKIGTPHYYHGGADILVCLQTAAIRADKNVCPTEQCWHC